jgi:hypothetical protein
MSNFNKTTTATPLTAIASATLDTVQGGTLVWNPEKDRLGRPRNRTELPHPLPTDNPFAEILARAVRRDPAQ